MNRLKKIFVALTVIAGIVLLVFLNMKFRSFSEPGMKRGNSRKNFPAKVNTRTKRILIYTPVFGVFPWPGVKTDSYFSDRNGELCPVSNCVFTFDKKDLEKSDALIFHSRDIPSVETMKEISLNKNRLRQRWIYYSHENPYLVHHDITAYNYIFNWTMTYRYDSDIFIPYRYYRQLHPEEAKRVVRNVNHASGKDKLVAWSVGHCGRVRDKIVKKLLKYIDITIFGKCAKNFNQRNECKAGSRLCDLEYKRYKFYLSFENSMCLDYVTEKYWYTPFENNMVPIVLGSNYDKRVAIPGSYINTIDFPSIKALASYLQYLDKNDTAYNEYFKWKEKYTFHEHFSSDCKICAKLHDDKEPVKIYKNLDVFWGRVTCNQHAEDIRRLLKDNITLS